MSFFINQHLCNRCFCLFFFFSSVNWIKMKPHTENSPICFGSLGDNPGMFTTPSSGDVITFKLVHVYGKVSCHLGCLSNWGCRSRSEPEKMGTYIADSNKTRLLPNNAELFVTAFQGILLTRLNYYLIILPLLCMWQPGSSLQFGLQKISLNAMTQTTIGKRHV